MITTENIANGDLNLYSNHIEMEALLNDVRNHWYNQVHSHQNTECRVQETLVYQNGKGYGQLDQVFGRPNHQLKFDYYRKYC